MLEKDVWNHAAYAAVLCLVYLASRVVLVNFLGLDDAQFLAVAATAFLAGLTAILYSKMCATRT